VGYELWVSGFELLRSGEFEKVKSNGLRVLGFQIVSENFKVNCESVAINIVPNNKIGKQIA
jgi:hypothetical protein